MALSPPIVLQISTDPSQPNDAESLCVLEPAPPASIIQDASVYTLVFASPETLKIFAPKLSGPAAEIIIPTSASTEPLVVPKSQITTLKVSILAHIQAMTPMSETELCGGIRADYRQPVPTMGYLVPAWREAFRLIPDDFPFECVVFNMECERDIEVKHILVLLQGIGTVLYLKRKRAGGGRPLRFDVEGVSAKKKTWILKALPVLEASNVDRGSEA